MPEDRPIVYTVTPSGTDVRIYTRDSRVEVNTPSLGFKDKSEIVCKHDNVVGIMIGISKILNEKGYAVLFEAD